MKPTREAYPTLLTVLFLNQLDIGRGTVVDCDISSTCGGSCAGTQGSIRLSKYHMSQRQDCYYDIHSSDDVPLELSFSDFHHEQASLSVYCDDYIEVFDYNGGRRLAKFCSSGWSPRIESYTGRLYIHVHNTKRNAGTEFTASWGPLPPSASNHELCVAAGGRCIGSDIVCTDEKIQLSSGCEVEDATTPVCCGEYFRLDDHHPPSHRIAKVEVDGITSRGRVEVLHDGEWGTVCDINEDAADLICRSVNVMFQQAVSFQRADEVGFFPALDRRVWLQGLTCDSDAASIAFCSLKGWGVHVDQCGHEEEMIVECTAEAEESGYSWVTSLLFIALVACVYQCCRKIKHKLNSFDFDDITNCCSQQREEVEIDAVDIEVEVDMNGSVPTPASPPTIEQAELIPPFIQIDNLHPDAPPPYSDALNYPATDTPSFPLPSYTPSAPTDQDEMPPPSYDEISNDSRRVSFTTP